MTRLTGYLGSPERLAELQAELGQRVVRQYGLLLLAEGPPIDSVWARNVWFDPQLLPAPSVKQAAKALRDLQRNWAHYPLAHTGRAKLIGEHLPHVSAKPLVFPDPAPTAPLGSWCLLGENLILAAPACSSPFANGEPVFVEDKNGPPNRAYLKLWEALTRLGVYPGPGETCLDLGASPGGWTWVLAGLGARVIAVDKAPLEAKIAAMPGVSCRRESAFGLDPVGFEPVDWLFSDVICYPARLLNLIERWLAAGTAKRFVCTIKFQGETDFEALAQFAALPGARILHLHQNKHEVTLFLPGPQAAPPQAVSDLIIDELPPSIPHVPAPPRETRRQPNLNKGSGTRQSRPRPNRP